MIDNFALGLSHGLMLLAAWRLLFRDDLDREPSVRDVDVDADADADAPAAKKRRNRFGA